MKEAAVRHAAESLSNQTKGRILDLLADVECAGAVWDVPTHTHPAYFDEDAFARIEFGIRLRDNFAIVIDNGEWWARHNGRQVALSEVERQVAEYYNDLPDEYDPDTEPEVFLPEHFSIVTVDEAPDDRGSATTSTALLVLVQVLVVLVFVSIVLEAAIPT